MTKISLSPFPFSPLTLLKVKRQMIKKGFKVRSRQFRWWVWYWGRVAIAPFQLLFLKGHEQIRVRVRFWIAMFKIDRVRLLSFLNDLLW